MPVSFNSPARNLFLLGSTGDIVGNFFKTIDQSSTTDSRHIPAEIRYNESDEKYLLAGQARDVDDKDFGFFEKRDLDGIAEWDVKVESTEVGVNTTLRAMELDSNGNLIVAGKTGSIPWVAKYSNGGVIDWQSTTNTADIEYTGLAIDSNDNIYACGSTPFNGGLIGQAFVEKFDSSGTPGWGKSAFMVGRDAVLLKCSVNTRGEVVAVGYLEDDSAWKGYIVKIDTTTGNVLWDRTLSSYELTSIGDYVNLICEDVYIDNQDQIYIVGRTNNPWTPRSTRGFIVKYSAEGNIIWQKETEDNIEFYNVRSDGDTEQTIVMGGQTQDGTALSNVVLSSYAKNGDLIWRRKIVHDNRTMDSTPRAYGLDFDSSFYYIFFKETSFVFEDTYTYARVSISGNGAGNFDYNSGATNNISYDILNVGDKIGRLSDGSVRQDSSDLITYPFSANKLIFDDLATQVSNKKRQMDTADSFEYSGSPAIRPADFQELNLLGDTGFVEGPDLMPNGTFDSNIDGWVGYNSTPAWDAGRLKINAPTQNDGAETSSGVPVSPNTNYTLSFDITYGTASAFLVQVRNSSNEVFPEGNITLAGTTSGTHTIAFNSYSNTSVYVRVMSGASTGTAFFDNIKLQEVKVLDQSGKGNDGVVNGATHNAAGYWEFDGVDDYISGNTTPLANTTEGTIESWIKTTSTANPGGHIYGESLPGTSTYWAHFRLNGSVLHFVVDDNIVVAQANGSSILNDGNWHHVAVTGDGTNWTFYVDGVAETPNFIQGDGTKWFNDAPGLTHYSIGVLDRTTRSNFFDGEIGEVRIYPRALTPAQVFQNYNATREKYTGVPASIYPKLDLIVKNGLILNLDAGVSSSYPGTGTTWTDLSGNGNTGTLVNGVGYNSGNGGSLVFDGSNDYVRGETTYSPTALQPLTLSVWFYNKGQSGNRGILGIINPFSQPIGSARMIVIRSTGAVYFWGSSSDFNPTNFISEVNSWTNAVFTIDTAKKITAYKNGIFNDDATISSLNDTNALNYDVGVRSLFNEYFDGNISQVSIYNRALTAQEVLQNFNALRTRFGL
ncbi:hypothetical protein S-PM2d174 [Synechococcus phage S-PM2]|uniref:Hypothetical-Protein / belonging to T4-LIKE GC: 864 n=1 Tax=Synechococcus phage S-PM2 TaxID=238854 RepID=Q5GQG3_BPSYP|nr:virion structural protein [Synechococcus phage S-PM2]CAF34239.1 Hypothetical-Protein / belonging to T4-LIKE GC: 864 [Synechococcus phage S-PM2]CFW42382.1 hypothetical protein S-PM2d174 [Synechococcus phage S-PM2]